MGILPAAAAQTKSHREGHMDLDRRAFLQDSAGAGAFALASVAFWRVEPAMAQAGSGHELAALTIVELSQLLANRRITSRQLVEQGLVALKDPRGGGPPPSLSVEEGGAPAPAAQGDGQRREGEGL